MKVFSGTSLRFKSNNRFEINHAYNKQINMIKQVLESLTQQEQQSLFQAMNIDPKSLQKRSEQEFLNAEPNPVLAKTQYRYYMMKRLDNFNKIKDFLERAQNQTFHHSRPIYMSKEHGKMLM
jgi:hypothetical protein